MQPEVFLTKKPKDPLLRKYISYYYFHISESDTLEKNFIYFPGYKNALTIYRNSKVSFSKNSSSVTPAPGNDFIFLYSGHQTQKRTAFIKAPFNKIGVVFNELGINHFIDRPLVDLSPDPIDKSFNQFGNQMIDSCELIYSKEDLDDKVDLLDHFFVDRLTDFHQEALKTCVEIIINSSRKPSVTALSNSLEINRKTLLRLFQKHLCCSVKDYINIALFRNAMNSYLLKNPQSSLTEIAHENHYYDQAQFIHHFKKMTHTNPKKFFSEVLNIGNEDTFWIFR